MDLIKVMFFGGSRSGVVAGRRVLAVESTFVVGGRRVSVAGEQSWPLRRHGYGWLAEQGCDVGVEAPGTSLAQSVHWTTGTASADVVFLPVGFVVVLLLLPSSSG